MHLVREIHLPVFCVLKALVYGFHTSFFLSQVLLRLPLSPDVEVLAEKDGVHDGLWKEPDDEPHH